MAECGRKLTVSFPKRSGRNGRSFCQPPLSGHCLNNVMKTKHTNRLRKPNRAERPGTPADPMEPMCPRQRPIQAIQAMVYRVTARPHEVRKDRPPRREKR